MVDEDRGAVFTIAGQAFTWDDVVASARLNGTWATLERSTAQSLACLRRLTASGEELDANAMAEAEGTFRHARRLLAGEQMVAWLERRRLTVHEWRDYLRRSVARERWAEELPETLERFPVSAEEVETALWPEAVCSGALDAAAWQLAGDAALALDAGEALAGERAETLRRIADSAERARAGAVTADAVADEVERRGLEWLRVEGRLVELPTEAMAREAALLVRDDGRALEEIAAECGVRPSPLRIYMGEADPALSSALLGADPGDLVGPLVREDSFELVLIESKVRPAVADPDVRRKAERLLVTRLTERAIAANVSWHEPV